EEVAYGDQGLEPGIDYTTEERNIIIDEAFINTLSSEESVELLLRFIGGLEVSVEIVFQLIEPEDPQNDGTADVLKQQVEQLESEGEFESDQDPAHALKLHLTAVSHYEKQEKVEKFIKHMESFKLLLDHQKDNELLSDNAYDILITETDRLLDSSN